MWKNQRGFSLVEIIVVIAMIGILAGSAFVVVGHISYADTKKAVEGVDDALSSLRLDAMSREGRRYLYIYKIEDGANDGYYAKLLDEEDVSGIGELKVGPAEPQLNNNATRLGGADVKFFADDVEITGNNNYICVAYKKNGLFLDDDELNNWLRTNAEHITIKGSGTYKISLNRKTGKHSIE